MKKTKIFTVATKGLYIYVATENRKLDMRAYFSSGHVLEKKYPS